MPNSRAATSASAPPAPASGRAALIVCAIAGLLMLTVAAVRLLRDGSFWLDEAGIAVNLIQQQPLELLGPYPTGHSFPRLYLIGISLLMDAFGYHTMLLRLLPFCAFAAGLALWLRLGFIRFRSQPLLLGLMLVLTLIPSTWFAHAAMLKQYTMDVFLAFVPLLLSDAFLDRRLREGRGRAALLVLPLLCLLSFSFLIPLLARLIAWYAAALVRGRSKLDVTSTLSFAASFIGSLGLLWALDLRHTAGSTRLFVFWQKCIPKSDWSRAPDLFGNFFTGWYRNLPHGSGSPLPEPLIALLMLALVGGCAAIVWRTFARGAACGPDEASWGSRSLACVITVGGVILASLVVQYPICPGRLTLFAFFPMLIITLEGFEAASRALAHTRGGPWLAKGAIALTILLMLPTSYGSARLLVTLDTPENIRPLLHHIETKPELPILVASCSTYQLATLPEWLGREDVLYYDDRNESGDRRGFKDLHHFWLVSTGTNFYCPWFYKSLELRASRIKRYQDSKNSASLLEVWIPERISRPSFDAPAIAPQESEGASDEHP